MKIPNRSLSFMDNTHGIKNGLNAHKGKAREPETKEDFDQLLEKREYYLQYKSNTM
jgi:hypothetical protein